MQNWIEIVLFSTLSAHQKQPKVQKTYFWFLFWQAENIRVNQCHVMSWNTDLDNVKQMWDTQQFSHIAYSISETLGTAQLFLDFRKQTYTGGLKTQMESLGCTEISVTTFGNDGGKMAGCALNSVQKAGEREQHSHGSFGECKAAVMKAAQEKRKEDEQKAKEDRAEEAAKTAAAISASMGVLVEGVAQIGEQMVTHDDVQGLRSDSVDAMRDLDQRFKETQQALHESQKSEAETKRVLQQAQKSEADTKRVLQQALDKSQHAEGETKKSLQSTQRHLTDEQEKNQRQKKMISILNQKKDDAESNINTLKRAKSGLETENAELKTKLSNLRSLQTMQDDVRFLKIGMGMISEQITTKFKAQDEKQDGILAAVRGTTEVAGFSTDCYGNTLFDVEEDGVGFKRLRPDDLSFE
jgi:hypothetical protein